MPASSAAMIAVGDLLIVVARHAVGSLRGLRSCWSGCSVHRGVLPSWVSGTPLPPRVPADRGKGAHLREAMADPLRRADGDAVGSFHFKFVVLISPLCFPCFVSSRRELQSPVGEGREGQGRALTRSGATARVFIARKNIIPVIQPVGREDRVEPHPGLRRQVLETRGVTPAGDVRVRRGDQDAGGIGRQTSRSCWSAATVAGPMPPAVAA